MIASIAVDMHLFRGAIVTADSTVHVVQESQAQAFLNAFTALVKTINPDVMVNFGGRRNDWRALDDAWKSLGKPPFDGWSRVPEIAAETRPDTADIARVTFTCPGRIEFDVQAWLQRNQSIKIRSYDLDDVVREFLKRDPADGCEGRAKDVIELLNTASPKNKSYQVRGRAAPYYPLLFHDL